jgi:hypothetical protein
METEYSVNDVVNAAINGDVLDLQKTFDNVMRDKIDYALELKRQEIGQKVGTKEEE